MHTDPEQAPEGAAHRRLTTGDEDLLVREEPLLITVGGQQLITMRTPGDDFHLALGFLLSEGVIDAADDVLDHQFTPGEAGGYLPVPRLKLTRGGAADRNTSRGGRPNRRPSTSAWSG